MRAFRAALTASVTIALTVALWPVTAAAGDDDHLVSTSAYAVAQADGQVSTVADVDRRRTRSDIVRADNVAVAYAHCTDCRSLAVAFQIVFASRRATDIVADNTAVAVNDHCDRCVSQAFAAQFIVASDGKLSLTADGVRQLNEVRQRLRRLAADPPSPAVVDAVVTGLIAQVADVLSTDLRTRVDVHRHRSSQLGTAPPAEAGT